MCSAACALHWHVSLNAKGFPVEVWDALAIQRLQVLRDNSDEVTSPVLSPEDSMILTADCSRVTRFWQTDVGVCVWAYKLDALDASGQVSHVWLLPNSGIHVGVRLYQNVFGMELFYFLDAMLDDKHPPARP